MGKFTLGICAVFLPVILGWSPVVQADAVTDWNAHAGQAIIVACIDTLNASRLYAMLHIAVHDALHTIDRRFQPYVLDIVYSHDREPSGASAPAAVATAAHDVLVPVLHQMPVSQACIDAGIASVEADYTDALDAIADGTPKTQGVVIGHAAAALILALRVADGADAPLVDPDYPQGTRPGEYRFTPGISFAFGEKWGEVTPFVLAHNAQFRPGPPYEVTSRKYAADFNEIKSLGAKESRTRTAEQTQIGLFWEESSPLIWNRIARTVAAATQLDMWEHARLFGLLNIALADGTIGSLEAKYHDKFWRPVTAIRNAATDGNPNTEVDVDWEPFASTPPSPDYDATQAVEAGAAAQVLERFFETDEVSFSTCSRTLPDAKERCGGAQEVHRAFSSFTQAAQENGVSRILIGIHFRKAIEAGIKHGQKIGNRAVNLFLRPVQ
jgi:hypothetical protein